MGIRVNRKHDLKLGQVVHIDTTEFVADVSPAEGGDGAGRARTISTMPPSAPAGP